MKRITLFILAIVMITVSVSANTYDDSSVLGNPYVEEAIKSGVISSENLDNLKDKITREKACEIIVDVLKSELPDVMLEKRFDDTDNKAVEYLYNIGVVGGKGNNKFCPDDFVTREEMAKIAVNTYIIMHSDYVDKDYYNGYWDEYKISQWALSYVSKSSGLGIMSGIYNGEFPYFAPILIF